MLSDVNSRQDVMDERISNLEDRINSIQVSLDVLPDILTRCIQQQFEFTNFHQYFGQHNTAMNQQPHHQTSSSTQQPNSVLSTSLKQPIQPQNQQPLALTHQQQPSSFQDGDFASLQIATTPSPSNPPGIGASLGNNPTVLSGQQPKSTTNVPYSNNQVWQYPPPQQQQNTNVSVPSTTGTNWQTNNPVPPAPTTLGQPRPNIQPHLMNRPSPSVHPHQNQAALISAPTSSSAVTLTPLSSNAPPANSQLHSAHQQAPQLPQSQPQHIAPPPAYHIAAQSSGRITSTNIPTIAPPPPLPPRSQLDSSAKSMSSSLTGTVSEAASATSGISSTSNVGFQPQPPSVRNRHSHHQDQHSGPHNAS